jgi:Tfp pilus assembly protein PilV
MRRARSRCSIFALRRRVSASRRDCDRCHPVPSMMKIGQRRGQGGFAIVEVLIAGIILGIAITGVSLLLRNVQTTVIGQGDRYVALYLAQQKMEKLVALEIKNGFSSPTLQTGDSTQTSGCATDPDREPCYNESNLQAGEQVGASLQRFTRTTCVNYVKDDDPTTPSDCTACSGGGTCTNNTKRITVTVAPGQILADAVTLVTVITNHPPNLN